MIATNDKQHLLTTKQMAQFCAAGFLRFDELVPEAINQAVMTQLDEHAAEGKPAVSYRGAGRPWDAVIVDEPGLGQVYRLPQVQGIMRSFLGPRPMFDHLAIHRVGPQHKAGQIWHADAIIDTRTHFDIQLFYFPHDTPREMGGTAIVPGSHMRRVNTNDISRYQNFIGQLPIVCKAGTIFAMHHGMWHCAQPNHTDRMRYMVKLRLNPTVKQQRLWNTDDIDDPEALRELHKAFGWEGNEIRIEFVQRIRLWRYLTGNDKFDMSLWLGRLENMPENVLEDV